MSNRSLNQSDMHQFKSDKKFYRKRIIAITRDLFKNNEHPDDINILHNNYAKQLVEYFKIGDKTDIVQEEYIGMSTKIEDDAYTPGGYCITKANKEILNINEPVATLDKYISIKKMNVDKEIVPKKKDIDLTNPVLRTKGLICKSERAKT